MRLHGSYVPKYDIADLALKSYSNLMDIKDHWNRTFSLKNETEVSWFQDKPEQSLMLIEKYLVDKTAGIIDVGGGTARLVDGLLLAGYQDISVLDISKVALDEAKTRLGSEADRLSWIVADVRQWKPDRTWDAWHDRAVFHFLITSNDQEDYIDTLSAATQPGAIIIMATFALDGPEKCSGLPVQRYSAETLTRRFGEKFSLLEEFGELHRTPGGVQQSFNYAVFERV